MTRNSKKLLRTHPANRKPPFTGGAEALDGTPDGTEGAELLRFLRRENRGR